MQSDAAKFTVGIFLLWGTLSVLAEFPTTSGLAVALAWSIAVGATYVYGDAAYTELRKVIG